MCCVTDGMSIEQMAGAVKQHSGINVLDRSSIGHGDRSVYRRFAKARREIHSRNLLHNEHAALMVILTKLENHVRDARSEEHRVRSQRRLVEDYDRRRSSGRAQPRRRAAVVALPQQAA